MIRARQPPEIMKKDPETMFRMIRAWQPPVIMQSAVCSTKIGPKQRRLVSCELAEVYCRDRYV